MEKKYFCGNEISETGLKNGRVDYLSLSKSFDYILNNNIIEETIRNGFEWELVNGEIYDEEADVYKDIYQYYIISDGGKSILSELTDEIVLYNEDLDIYVWGVCFLGMPWDYALTNIRI